MHRFKLFVIRVYSYGDPFWLMLSAAQMVFAYLSPWYVAWIAVVLAMYYYDMAIDSR